MLKPFAILLPIACAAAGAGHAQTAPAPGGVPAAWRADSRLASPRLDTADARIWTPDGEHSPTALDHRFAAAGLAASAGFVCDNDGHIPVLHGVAAGAEPGRLLGTTLRLGF